MVYFPSEVFVHRSLIIVLEPGNSDVAHVCFAHQKKEVFDWGGGGERPPFHMKKWHMRTGNLLWKYTF